MTDTRMPDRSDWVNCDHGAWELREVCARCAERSIVQYRADLLREVRAAVEARLRYHESKSLTNGWSQNQSGPCCEKCEMREEHFTGRADALKALAGCRNPFQLPEVCECHLPTRAAVKNGVLGVFTEVLAAIDKLADTGVSDD